jgi:anti-sigma B factor antagonist
MSEKNRLEVAVAHLDGFVRVKLRGDLDYRTTDEYAQALRKVTDIREHVVLDLAEVTFVDSAGLRFLVTLAQGHDGPVRLEHVAPGVRTVLAVAGLSQTFDLDPE